MIRGPSPSPLLGGTIGTNSLGYLGGKYGAMGDQVLGVEAVLPTGEVIATRAVEKSSTGPGLHRLFIGAEGCFGIVTHATLRLFPLPQARLLQAWEFADFATGFAAINALLQAGLRPVCSSISDENPAVDHTPPATLIVSFEGPRRVAQAEAEEAVHLCTAHQGRQLPLSHAETFWAQRHDSGDAYAAARAAGQAWNRYLRRHPLDYLHVALPPLPCSTTAARAWRYWPSIACTPCKPGSGAMLACSTLPSQAPTRRHSPPYRWCCSSSVRNCMAPWNTATVWACVWHH